MAASVFSSAAVIAVAVLGRVSGFHHTDPCANSHPTALQHLRYLLVGGYECKSNASDSEAGNLSHNDSLDVSHNLSSNVSQNITQNVSQNASQNVSQNVSHGDFRRVVNQSGHRANGPRRGAANQPSHRATVPQHVLTWAEVPGATEAGNAAVHADSAGTERGVALAKARDPISELNASSAPSDSDALESSEAIREQVRELDATSDSGELDPDEDGDAETAVPGHHGGLNASSVSSRVPGHIRELDASIVSGKVDARAGAHGQGRGFNATGENSQWEVTASIHGVNMSGLSNEASHRYAGSTIDAMKHTLKAAVILENEAKQRLEKAAGVFLKARESQAKADLASKDATDMEAELTDAKAAALRNITAAKAMSAAAAKANMDAVVDAAGNTQTLKRDMHSAEEAVFRTKRNLDAVRQKLVNAEKAAAATQDAAAREAQKTVAAYQEMQAAKEAAAQATAKRAEVEEHVSKAAARLAQAAETFDGASKAKTDALEAFKTAKEDLVEASHVPVIDAQKAAHGTPQTPSAPSTQRKLSNTPAHPAAKHTA